MHTKNKLGIYVYPPNTNIINNIPWNVNSVSYTNLRKFRIINDNYYGIYLTKDN